MSSRVREDVSVSKKCSLIVFSPCRVISGEAEMVNELFASGMDFYHVRKSDGNSEKVKRFLSSIDSRWYDRLVIHSHFSLLDEFPFQAVHISADKKDSLLYKLFVLNPLVKKHPDIWRATTINSLEEFRKPLTTYRYVFLNGVFNKVAFDHAALAYTKASLENRLHHSQTPVIAKGMITENSIKQAMDLGFSGVALQEDFWSNPDPVNHFLKVKSWIKSQG